MDPQALQAAFEQIRASIDSAEAELMRAKRPQMPPKDPPEEEMAEGESPEEE